MQGAREPILDSILRESLLQERMPTIQVDDNAGRLLQLLVTLLQPTRVLEVGTLFGYSSIFLARGLGPGGRLTSLEKDPAAAALAERNLARAGVADRVEVVVGDAMDYLNEQPESRFDLIFLDADKRSYPQYLTKCFPLLTVGGLLVADDAFADGDFRGEVEGVQDDHVEENAIRTYAAAVSTSSKMLSAFVESESGMLLSLKL